MATERLSKVGGYEGDPDEVEEVLAALGELAHKVASPMIRVCLESARDDIAHLVGTGERSEDAADGEGDDFGE